MDTYTFSLALGAAGLTVMAASGLGRHGHHGQSGHQVHHGPDGHHGHDHGAAHHHDAAPHHGAAQHAAAPHHHGGRDVLWSLASPRVLCSALVGFGATGLLLRPFVGGVALVALALLGGVAFERLVVAPLWRFLLRFASAPARTLESALLDEARAASGFDANGQGLVALEVDGQVVQVLGTLRHEDRVLGLRVRAGDRLRVEHVDPERHRCTVSFLGR
ncbi:hypothetical protein [Roseisolibacter agri]|uniref:Uncharacterized protein n=1 Tax=Roseisolibacter agri TaxID=2014610 RepID=A0AA37QGE2_9BACT|nr:hypothetical protein [Roseisolibacter agri]GLC25313.1 hypothetical protein rosag_18260 [Roseisolibacter agri]